jgi:hypothetical protein
MIEVTHRKFSLFKCSILDRRLAGGPDSSAMQGTVYGAPTERLCAPLYILKKALGIIFLESTSEHPAILLHPIRFLNSDEEEEWRRFHPSRVQPQVQFILGIDLLIPGERPCEGSLVRSHRRHQRIEEMVGARPALTESNSKRHKDKSICFLESRSNPAILAFGEFKYTTR